MDDACPLDHRRHPERYRIGRGEQGVMNVEPYKSELLPHWRFKTPELARASAAKLEEMFFAYKAAGDFVGMDMARKYLQMGYTRSRRYAKRPSGRKYDAQGALLPIGEEDPIKAASARIFHAAWRRVREDREYLSMKEQHRERYERG
ncbi:DUF4385 domain-containing protein [Halotalea alkalilenta]|uniref:Cytoplasmic protein n=1 Tax=Halotalea alkalilenta TaxID=376489 RepID=A0A172YHZ9_9GAMM|nr:DUF4385 domain-containing protein [Halotalea alkalilenta]ANF58860.1 hypothetical protein A5892_16450 [Halotalea alkalilenta]